MSRLKPASRLGSRIAVAATDPTAPEVKHVMSSLINNGLIIERKLGRMLQAQVANIRGRQTGLRIVPGGMAITDR